VYIKHTINIDKCASEAHNGFNPSARSWTQWTTSHLHSVRLDANLACPLKKYLALSAQHTVTWAE